MRLVRRLWLEVLRIRAGNAYTRRQRIMQQLGIALVIDVGANRGQYASALRDFGYTGRIVSVEPHAETFKELERASSSDHNWTVINAGLSRSSGHRMLNVSSVTTGSSFHRLTPQATEWLPEFSYVGKEEVEILTLDDLLPELADTDEKTLLKIDTQGHESEVLEGAKSAIQLVDLIEVELSLQPLYEGQASWLEVVESLAALGFSLIAVEPVFSDPKTGYMVEIDGLFRRS